MDRVRDAGAPPPRGRNALSGPAPPRAARVDRQRMGRLRHQPPRKVLPPHHPGPGALPRRSAQGAPPRRSHCRRAQAIRGGTGMTLTPGWRRLFRPSIGARAIERDVDDELAFHLAMREDKLRRLRPPPDPARVPAPRRLGKTAPGRKESLTHDPPKPPGGP